MLSKPLTHLRPLLRLPSHAQPEHFTSNPSLLHHFPSQSGHAIANAGSSSAQAAGQAGGNAGRAGWNGGAGAGGSGYTGHARAFLSIPQTSAVDPSSGLTTDDGPDTERALLRRRHRLQASRFAQSQLADSQPESVRSALDKGKRVAIVDLVGPDERIIDHSRLLEDAAPGPSRRGRRSSIAFPQQAVSSSTSTSSPARSRPHTPRIPLGRSTSSSELWQVGVPVRPRAQLRAFSTHTPPIPLPDLDGAVEDLDRIQVVPVINQTTPSPASSRLIPQPNHVLMDLAGLDIPPSRSFLSPTTTLGRRYNSSLASENRSVQQAWDDLMVSPPSERRAVSSGPLNADQERRKLMDIKIYNGIVGARRRQDYNLARKLVAHYRSSRKLAAFDERTQPGDPELVEQYPLPRSFTTQTYNACIEVLLYSRKPGESIAGVLEAYNEMLDRNVMPNSRTYDFVIRALCFRERDVWQAAGRWEKDKQTVRWLDSIDAPYARHANPVRDPSEQGKLIAGYIGEGNLDSALKLYRAALVFQNTSAWTFNPTLYNLLLDTISSTDKPDLEAMEHVFGHAVKRRVGGYLGLYRYKFRALAKAGPEKKGELVQAWEEIKDAALSAGGEDPDGHWQYFGSLHSGGEANEDRPHDTHNTQTAEAALRIMGEKRRACYSAIEAFARIGAVDEAWTILEAEEKRQEGKSESQIHPDLYAAYLVGLGEYDVRLAAKEYTDRVKARIEATPMRRLSFAHLYDMVDVFTLGGEWRVAADIIESIKNQPEKEFQPDFARARRVYTAMIHEARQDSASTDFVRDITRAVVALHSNFPSPVIMSDALTEEHIRTLKRHELWSEALPLLRTFQPNGKQNLRRYGNEFALSAVQKLPLAEGLELLRVMKVHGHSVAEEPMFARIIADRYHQERSEGIANASPESASPSETEAGGDSTGEIPISSLTPVQRSRLPGSTWSPIDLGLRAALWASLVNTICHLNYQGAFREGDYDHVLEALVTDMSLLRLGTGTGPQDFSEVFQGLARTHSRFSPLVRFRFGDERAKEMLNTAYGEDGKKRAKHYDLKVRLPTDVDLEAAAESADGSMAPQGSEQDTTSPGLESGDGSVSTLSDPTTPPPAGPDVNTPHAPPKPAPFLDVQLSQYLDGHMSRPARMSVDQAYRALKHHWEINNIAVHPSAIGRLIMALAREGNAAAAMELYGIGQIVISSSLQPQDQPHEWRKLEDSMIIASCHLGQLEQAGIHRQRIIDAGTTPSPDAYATMIASSKDTTDDAMVARDLWDEVQLLGVKPHLYLYNTIISKLSKARKAEMALEMFAQMKNAGVAPSSVTYGAIINACCRVGDVESAETLFDEMKHRRNFKPKVPPFNTMIQFFIQTVPNREKALYYYNELHQAKVAPSAHTYKLLMDMYSTLPPMDLDAMEQIHSQLKADRDVPVQGTHYASLITAYGIYDSNLPKAMDIFRSIPAPTGRAPDARVEPVVWEAILNVVAHRGSLADLEALRAELVSSAVKPTAYVYNVLIMGYSRANEVQRAREVFESMGDSVSGVAAPNNHPALLTGAGYVKPQTRTEVPTHMVYREPSTYEAMVRAELAAGEVGRARDVYARMEARGYPWAVMQRVKAVVDEADVNARLASTGQATQGATDGSVSQDTTAEASATPRTENSHDQEAGQQQQEPGRQQEKQ